MKSGGLPVRVDDEGDPKRNLDRTASGENQRGRHEPQFSRGGYWALVGPINWANEASHL